jgi:hypothetical protein
MRPEASEGRRVNMAMLAEYTFVQAVQKAEGVRQSAKAAAFVTWGYGTGAAFSTYVSALESADNTYIASVNSAASTLGAIGLPVPGQGGTPLANVVIGNVGMAATSPRSGSGWASNGPVPLP